MAWADDLIANPMGYNYAVLFPRGRDALWAYELIVGCSTDLPTNICSQIVRKNRLVEIDQETGLANVPVHLYGYRSGGAGNLALDPHCTGFLCPPTTASSIVSFGPKKMFSIGGGGAFITNNQSLAQEMEEKSGFPLILETYAQAVFTQDFLPRLIEAKRLSIALWDRYLGDSLKRIPQEQIMPWRVMRRAWSPELRTKIVRRLRGKFDVNTMYQPISGSNEWGDTVLNFGGGDKDEIKACCAEINEVINGR